MTFSLRLTKLIATLNFPRYSLPYWLGNKFRGGFGSVLLKAVCGYLKPECKNCVSRDDCLYYALYIRDRQKRGKSQPVRPIIFIPPFFGKKIEGGGEIKIEINVFGDYIKYLPHIVYGLRFLGKVGLNSASKYELIRIADFFSGREVYDGESIVADKIKPIDVSNIDESELGEYVQVNFKTPVEVQRIPFSLSHLLKMTRQRLIFFVNEYGGGNVPEFKCEDTIVSFDLRKHRLMHVSKRLGKRVFTGYTGHIKYRVVNMNWDARRLLEIGRLIGAGAKSSFGLGFYDIEGYF